MTYSPFLLRFWLTSSLEDEQAKVTAQMRSLNRAGTATARAKAKALFVSVQPVINELRRRTGVELAAIGVIDTTAEVITTGASFGAGQISDAIVGGAGVAGKATGNFAGGLLSDQRVQIAAALLLTIGGFYIYSQAKG